MIQELRFGLTEPRAHSGQGSEQGSEADQRGLDEATQVGMTGKARVAGEARTTGGRPDDSLRPGHSAPFQSAPVHSAAQPPCPQRRLSAPFAKATFALSDLAPCRLTGREPGGLRRGKLSTEPISPETERGNQLLQFSRSVVPDSL